MTSSCWLMFPRCCFISELQTYTLCRKFPVNQRQAQVCSAHSLKSSVTGWCPGHLNWPAQKCVTKDNAPLDCEPGGRPAPREPCCHCRGPQSVFLRRLLHRGGLCAQKAHRCARPQHRWPARTQSPFRIIHNICMQFVFPQNRCILRVYLWWSLCTL